MRTSLRQQRLTPRHFHACAVDEALIKSTADLLVNEGFLDAGYVYLNLDGKAQANEC